MKRHEENQTTQDMTDGENRTDKRSKDKHINKNNNNKQQ